MKKLMSVMLALTFALGTVSLFAQDAPKDDKMASSTAKKTKKAKKSSKKTDAKAPDAPKM